MPSLVQPSHQLEAIIHCLIASLHIAALKPYTRCIQRESSLDAHLPGPISVLILIQPSTPTPLLRQGATKSKAVVVMAVMVVVVVVIIVVIMVIMMTCAGAGKRSESGRNW